MRVRVCFSTSVKVWIISTLIAAIFIGVAYLRIRDRLILIPCPDAAAQLNAQVASWALKASVLFVLISLLSYPTSLASVLSSMNRFQRNMNNGAWMWICLRKDQCQLPDWFISMKSICDVEFLKICFDHKPVAFVKSSPECSRAERWIFLATATNFKAVFCESELRGVGSFPKEKSLHKWRSGNLHERYFDKLLKNPTPHKIWTWE